MQNAILTSLKTPAPALQAGGTTIHSIGRYRVQDDLDADYPRLKRVKMEAGHG